jgi:hypothetical protein
MTTVASLLRRTRSSVLPQNYWQLSQLQAEWEQFVSRARHIRVQINKTSCIYQTIDQANRSKKANDFERPSSFISFSIRKKVWLKSARWTKKTTQEHKTATAATVPKSPMCARVSMPCFVGLDVLRFPRRVVRDIFGTCLNSNIVSPPRPVSLSVAIL